MRGMTLGSAAVLVIALGTAGVIVYGNPDARALKSADALLVSGDAAGAASAYREISTKSGSLAPIARVRLGVALERQGDLDGSIRELTAVRDSGPADVVPIANAYLGYSLF